MSIVDGTSWASAFVERHGEVELIDLSSGRTVEGWAGYGSKDFPMDRPFAAVTTSTLHCLIIEPARGRRGRTGPGPCRFFVISDDNSVLASAPLDGDVELLRLAGREPVATLPAGVAAAIAAPLPGPLAPSWSTRNDA